MLVLGPTPTTDQNLESIIWMEVQCYSVLCLKKRLEDLQPSFFRKCLSPQLSCTLGPFFAACRNMEFFYMEPSLHTCIRPGRPPKWRDFRKHRRRRWHSNACLAQGPFRQEIIKWSHFTRLVVIGDSASRGHCGRQTETEKKKDVRRGTVHS